MRQKNYDDMPLSLRVSTDLDVQIRIAAARKRISRSEFIRDAIVEKLGKSEDSADEKKKC